MYCAEMKKLCVVSIASDRSPGGIAKALISYSQALSFSKIRHVVLLPKGATVIPALEAVPLVTVIALPYLLFKFHLKTRFLFSSLIYNILKASDCILVHNSRLAHCLGRFKTQSVCVCHSGKIRSINGVFGYIFLTHAAQLRDSKHIPEAQHWVVPHGFESQASKAQKKKKACPQNMPLKVIAAGRFVAKKRFSDLIQSAACLEANGVPIFVTLYGKGEDEKALRTLIDNLNIKNVKITGWTDDFASACHDADLFCLPSILEPFGLVIGEAMLECLPVLATRTDGPLEILGSTPLDHGGWLYHAGDIDALTNILTEIAHDRSSLIEYGQKAKSRILKDFSMTVLSQRLKAVVEDVASKNNQPAAEL